MQGYTLEYMKKKVKISIYSVKFKFKVLNVKWNDDWKLYFNFYCQRKHLLVALIQYRNINTAKNNGQISSIRFRQRLFNVVQLCFPSCHFLFYWLSHSLRLYTENNEENSHIAYIVDFDLDKNFFRITDVSVPRLTALGSWR